MPRLTLQELKLLLTFGLIFLGFALREVRAGFELGAAAVSLDANLWSPTPAIYLEAVGKLSPLISV